MKNQNKLELVEKPKDYTVAEIKDIIRYPGPTLQVYHKLTKIAGILPAGKRPYGRGIHVYSRNQVDDFIECIKKGCVETKREGNWLQFLPLEFPNLKLSKSANDLKVSPKPPLIKSGIIKLYDRFELAKSVNRANSTVLNWLRELDIKPVDFDTKKNLPLYDDFALELIKTLDKERSRRSNIQKSPMPVAEKSLCARILAVLFGLDS